jgi:hypothetical protein
VLSHLKKQSDLGITSSLSNKIGFLLEISVTEITIMIVVWIDNNLFYCNFWVYHYKFQGVLAGSDIEFD